jgi:hypothetical protein
VNVKTLRQLTHKDLESRRGLRQVIRIVQLDSFLKRALLLLPDVGSQNGFN